MSLTIQRATRGPLAVTLAAALAGAVAVSATPRVHSRLRALPSSTEAGIRATARARFPASDTTVTLHLLATTDVHGRIYPWDYFGRRPTSYGLALLAPLIDSVRAANPGSAYLFDVGDLLQGTPLTLLAARPSAGGSCRTPPDPHPVIRAMNLLRYDASAVGNHEYNYGIAALDRALAQARFPFVAANVFRSGTREPAYHPYILIPHPVAAGDTIVIGVTGVTPPGVLVWDRANVQGRLNVTDPVASLKPVVAEMKTRGADVVVVLNHGGFEGTSYDTAAAGVPAENAGARIAREVPGVDVVVLGHTHRELADSLLAGVLFTQPGNYARSLADVTLTLARRGPSAWGVVAKHSRLLRPDPGRADLALEDSLRWAHERAVAYVAARIGRSAAAMDAARSRVEDTPLVDFMNEVQRRTAGAQLSATAAYSLAARVPGGPVTRGQIAALYPYENTLAAVRITGAQLKAYLEKSAEYFRGWPVPAGESLIDRDVPGYNFDIVSGVTYTIDLSRPVGSRIVLLRYRGLPVRPMQTFTMALNNYRQGGGGGFAMVARAPVVYAREQDIRDLLVDEVRRKGVVRPEDYFTPSWRIEPAAAREQAARELSAGESARPSGTRSAVATPARVAGAGAPANAAPRRLRVLTTNDLHGHLLPESYGWSAGREVGGAATLAAYFRAEREGFDGPVVLLDAGDEMQGTPISNLTRGRSSIAFFNAVAERAAAIGNHEFDWGVPVLRARVAQAKYPWLAANMFVAGTDTAPSWTRATTMLDVSGVRVGIIGLATQETPSTTKWENVRGLEFRDGAAAVDRWVPALRRQGADFVIVVAHSGGMCDSAGTANCRGEIVEWASRARERPDLIVAGHTHQVMRVVVNGIPIVQAAAYGTRYGVVDLEKGAPARIRDVPVAWSDRIAPDPAVAALVARYQAEIGPRVNAVVATLAEPLRKSTGDYPLGRLVADAWRSVTHAQVAFTNNGGIRSELKAGPVTWGKLFELQPFQNRLVVLTMTGARIRQAVETAVRGRDPDANVSGLSATFDPTRPPGSRVVTLTLSDGAPIVDTETYTVAMPDFLAGGGDRYSAFTNPVARKDTPLPDLDALIQYLRRLPQPVRGPQDPRLVAVRGGAGAEEGGATDAGRQGSTAGSGQGGRR